MPRTPHFQSDFTAAELLHRRARVAAAVGGNAHVFLAGAPESPGFDPFRQTNDFYYLTGVEVPHAYLLFSSAEPAGTLYLPPRDAKHEASDGPVLSDEDGPFARHAIGAADVRPLSALPADLAALRGRLFMPRDPAEGPRMCQDTLRHQRKAIDADPLDREPSREMRLRQRLAALNRDVEILDLSPILRRQRFLKSPAETDLMRRTGRVTADGIVAAMRATRPGVLEYQLAAAAEHVFCTSGSRPGGGYRPIVAAGDNAFLMHYWRNDAPLKDGQLVLMDYAPDINNYTSDIGRMWPVSGTFDPTQRRLYSFVVDYHRLLLESLRPGRLPEDVLAEAAARMRPRLQSDPFPDAAHHAAAERLLESKRPLSHGVGMAVHEAEPYFGRPLEIGTVIAVDPELLIPEQRLYVRCEDTVAVTPTGFETLTAAAPLDVDEIERCLRNR